MVSRRRLLKAGSALGASTAVSGFSPELFSAAARILQQVQNRPDLAGTTTLASLRSGAGPQEIGLHSLPTPDGPHAIVARRDGSFAILDTINRRVSILRGSNVAQTIPLRTASYPIDLVESFDRLYALDAAGQQVLDINGTTVTSHPLPRESRIRASRLGGAIGSHPVTVVEEDYVSHGLSESRASARPGFADPATGIAQVHYPTARGWRDTATIVFGNGVIARLSSRGFLGSAIGLGRDLAGRYYVQVNELRTGAAGIAVDIVVHRFLPDGTNAGVTRVPVRGRSAQPTRVVTITPAGDAVALFPDGTRTLVVQLTWTTGLVAYPPPLRLPEHAGVALAVNQIGKCRFETTQIADTYWLHPWTAVSRNLQINCSPSLVTLPGYLRNGPGPYREIPYCWGGNCVPAGFNERMNQVSPPITAGNTNATGCCFVGCTEGIDCSGFIGQCWGIGAKQDDTGLLQWVTNRAVIDPGNPPPWMGRGDMYRWPGRHVRMHDVYSSLSTGPMVYESGALNDDRVWYRFYSWSELDLYEWCLGNFVC